MVERRFLALETYEIHVNACITVKSVVGISLCNGGKLNESEDFNCCFRRVLCVRIEIG